MKTYLLSISVATRLQETQKIQEGALLIPALQGGIWGLSSLAATRATQEKKKEETKEEKRKRWRQLALAGAFGAGAGVASTIIPDMIKKSKEKSL